MVSPQSIETLQARAIPTASRCTASTTQMPLAAPTPTMQASMNKATSSSKTTPGAGHLFASPPRMKRTASFILGQELEPANPSLEPYLWSLHDDVPKAITNDTNTQSPDTTTTNQTTPISSSSSLPDSPTTTHDGYEMPPLQYGGFDQFYAPTHGNFFGESASHQVHMNDCPHCWSADPTICMECMNEKQQQFDMDGWSIGAPEPPATPLFWQQPSYIKQVPYHMQEDGAWVKQEPLDQYAAAYTQAALEAAAMDHPMLQQQISKQQPQQQPQYPIKQEEQYEEEQKMSDILPPLSSPLLQLPADHLQRLQGKLTKFLPEGQDMMAVDPQNIDLHYTTAFAASPTTPTQQVTEGRALRARKPALHSRSPSPDLSERSSSPESESYGSDSAYETDHYEAEEEVRPRRVRAAPIDQHMMDDTLSPPVVRYEDSSSSSSDLSTPEPPTTSLLPVSARDLLPSRPSTGVVPPSHIKDRLVKSAKKLLTAADGEGANDRIQVQVIPIYYPKKGVPGAHKIRLIRVQNTDDDSVSVYAHAADVGGVVERKSNISRLFGKFESPSEKLLMNVVGAHNHTVGQESNILTSKGVKKFLQTNKMKESHDYRHWITNVLMPKLLHDPLIIGDEILEIEASTDPHAPKSIKPKKLKRMEKKMERKLQEKYEEEHNMNKDSAAASSSTSSTGSLSPAPSAKRQKTFHSQSQFNHFSLQSENTPMSHAA